MKIIVFLLAVLVLSGCEMMTGARNAELQRQIDAVEMQRQLDMCEARFKSQWVPVQTAPVIQRFETSVGEPELLPSGRQVIIDGELFERAEEKQ